jgi:hypothetical protein
MLNKRLVLYKELLHHYRNYGQSLHIILHNCNFPIEQMPAETAPIETYITSFLDLCGRKNILIVKEVFSEIAKDCDACGLLGVIDKSIKEKKY